MKNRSNAIKAAPLLLLCAALAACSGKGGNEGANGSPSASANAFEQKAGSSVVTVSVLTKDRFLAEAERRFEAANPGIDIQIEELVPADTSGGDKMFIRKGGPQEDEADTANLDKYANGVNTALMSGKAADIISMQNLPIERYADKGLLADWNTFAGSDAGFNRSDYYENVLTGIADGGALYAIPVTFTMDMLLGNADLLAQNGLDDKTWTWNQFVDLLEKTKADGKYGISGMKPERLLAYVAETAYEELVKKNGKAASVDAAALQAYMEKIKRLYDSGTVSESMMGPDTMFNSASMSNPIDIVMMPQLPQADGSTSRQAVIRPPGTGQDEGIPFGSDQLFALNAASKEKEAAWAFVKYLLSEEMQSSDFIQNFPVNKAAFKSKLEEAKKMVEGSGEGEEGSGGRKLVMRGADGQELHPTISEADIEAVLNLMPSVGKFGNQDPKVIGMIKEESTAFFSGSKSAAVVAQSLASRIETYLNE